MEMEHTVQWVRAECVEQRNAEIILIKDAVYQVRY